MAQKRNSLATLITELSKFGTLSFGEFKSEFSEDTFNCDYKIKKEFEDRTGFMRISQNQSNLFEFCAIACLAFDLGISPIFDFYINKI